MIELIVSILMAQGIPCNNNIVNLLAETMAVESDYGRYNVQLNGGPARGVYQMELNTLNDLRGNYIEYHPEYERFLYGTLMDFEYATITAALQYERFHEPVPATRLERAYYWKKYWNTRLGKGTVEKYLDKSSLYIGEPYESGHEDK